jgi:hypothetical protein
MGPPQTETVARVTFEVLLGAYPAEGTTLRHAALVQRAASAQLGEEVQGTSQEVDAGLRLVSRELNVPRLRKAVRAAPAHVLLRIRNESQTAFRRLCAAVIHPPSPRYARLVDRTVRNALVPRWFFLAWFGMRYASPTFAKAAAAHEHEHPILVHPEPTLMEQLAREQRRPVKKRALPRRRP